MANHHGFDAAQGAFSHFRSLFGGDKRNEIPVDAPLYEIAAPGGDGMPILRAMMEAGLIASNGEGKRLIKQGGMVINGARVSSLDECLQTGEYAMRAGKKLWARLIIK